MKWIYKIATNPFAACFAKTLLTPNCGDRHNLQWSASAVNTLELQLCCYPDFKIMVSNSFYLGTAHFNTLVPSGCFFCLNRAWICLPGQLFFGHFWFTRTAFTGLIIVFLCTVYTEVPVSKGHPKANKTQPALVPSCSLAHPDPGSLIKSLDHTVIAYI